MRVDRPLVCEAKSDGAAGSGVVCRLVTTAPIQWFVRCGDYEQSRAIRALCFQCVSRHLPTDPPFVIQAHPRINQIAQSRLARMLLSDPAMARKRNSNSHPGGPCIEMERVLPSKVAAISPFVDKLMLLIKKCRCAPGIALHESLENAVIHGNHEDPRKHVYVRCRCKAEEEVSIIVKDEGDEFDSNALPDPTAPGAIELSHGRGIYLMKAFMHEVRFEQSGAVVHMRKKSCNTQPGLPKEV